MSIKKDPIVEQKKNESSITEETCQELRLHQVKYLEKEILIVKNNIFLRNGGFCPSVQKNVYFFTSVSLYLTKRFELRSIKLWFQT